MNVLSNVEIYQIHGGLNHQAQVQEVLTSAAHYSFYTTLFGLPISAIYALLTDTTVATTIGSSTVISGTFLPVFTAGVTLSWIAGAALGTAFGIMDPTA